MITEGCLRALRDVAAAAPSVDLRCIYGCGHEMLAIMTPFLIDTVKLVFNEMQ